MRLLLISSLLSVCSIISVDCFAHTLANAPPARHALHADFDNKIVGQPILTRGAMFGEPVGLKNLGTEVIQSAPGQNLLRVSNDLSSSAARYTKWRLLGNAELDTGEVKISFDVTASARDAFGVLVREGNSAAKGFMNLNFTAGGKIFAGDTNGVIAQKSNAYSANTTLSVEMVFDMDAKTSSLYLDGNSIFAGHPFGNAGNGIGSVLIGYNSSSNGSAFDLDNVRISGQLPFPEILNADFDDKTVGDPIGIGGAAVNEPYSMNDGTDAIVIEPSPGTRVLDVSTDVDTSSRYVRWQFLENLEVYSGLVIMDFDLQLEALGGYRVSVRESGLLSKNFLNLQFNSSGTMEMDDASGIQPLYGVTYDAGRVYQYRIIFDMDSGTYDIFRDGIPLLRERSHGITTRGIGSLLNVILPGSTSSTHLQLDNLRVLASDAAMIPARLEFLQEATTATTNQAVTPAIEVGVTNVLGDAMIDGTPVSLEIAPGWGPAGATLSGTDATTVSGIATFEALEFMLPGTYRLAAYSLDATRLSDVDVVVSASDVIFADGFEDETKYE